MAANIFEEPQKSRPNAEYGADGLGKVYSNILKSLVEDAKLIERMGGSSLAVGYYEIAKRDGRFQQDMVDLGFLKKTGPNKYVLTPKAFEAVSK